MGPDAQADSRAPAGPPSEKIPALDPVGQRSALTGLRNLVRECAAAEARITRDHAAAIQALDRKREQGLGDIEQRYLSLKADIEQKRAAYLRQIAERYEADIHKLNQSQEEARRKLEHEQAALEQDVKHQYRQETWLIESVFEGLQAQLQEQEKTDAKLLKKRLARVAELESQAQAWIAHYGQSWPVTKPSPVAGSQSTPENQPAAADETSGTASYLSEGGVPAEELSGSDTPSAECMAEGTGGRTTPPSHALSSVSPTSHPSASTAQEDPATDSTAAPVNFSQLCEAVEEELVRLATLRLPRLVSGALPVLATIAIGAVAAGIGQLVTGERTLQWLPMATASGLALTVAVSVGLWLRSRAAEQVRRLATDLQAGLDAARDAARVESERAAADRRRRLREAADKRERDLLEAKNRFNPVLNRFARTRQELLATLDAERARLMPRIEAHRTTGLAETQEWYIKALESLEQGRSNELFMLEDRLKASARAIEAQYGGELTALKTRWQDGLAELLPALQPPHWDTDPSLASWESEIWMRWVPPRTPRRAVRFGRLHLDPGRWLDQPVRHLELPAPFDLPALLSVPGMGSLLIHSDQAGRAEGIAALKSVMLRLLAAMPPGQVRFILIDPVGLGQSFAGFMHLSDEDETLAGTRIWTEREHLDRVLLDLTEHMETVIQKYLRNEFPTIDDYNTQAGELAEPYRFLVIADFPMNFSEVAIQRLNSIATSGPRCGVYTLVLGDPRQPLPGGTDDEALRAGSIRIVREQDRFVWDDPAFRTLPLTLDTPPPEDRLTDLLRRVGKAARQARRVEVPFTSITPPPERIWSGDSREGVKVPIGRLGATRSQMLRLGRGVAQHVLIAGKTGSGKSTLLHVLITNLALWYGPEEIEFYLVDFKKGVEFKVYGRLPLPHARAVAVESDREFGLSVLQRVDAELTRRGSLFRQAGVQDIAAYREATGRTLPRTLLIIDEFQEFFSEDDRLAQDAGLLLDRLVRQGRAFGIHVLLGSQTISGTSGLARSTLGQIAVRIALQTSEADSQIILGDGNSAARLLSRPGEAIYNDAGGLIEANSPFQVAWLPDEERDTQLEQVRRHFLAAGTSLPPPVVFEGNIPADLTRNTILAGLLAAEGRPPETTAPQIWLGEPVAIREPTAVTLRRQSGAHVLIIGQQEEPALAMMISTCLSLAAQRSPESTRFVVLDGSPADSPLARVLPMLAEALPHRFQMVEYRGVETAIQELADELHRRQAAGTVAGDCCLLIYGLQRYRLLRRREDGFSFGLDEAAATTPDRLLAELLREGPAVGIHAVVWCDTPVSVERTLDRSSLREFDHRVLFQMSAADSSNLIDSPLANRLGPNRALLYSEERGTLEKFRPYALPAMEWIREVAAGLRAREHRS